LDEDGNLVHLPYESDDDEDSNRFLPGFGTIVVVGSLGIIIIILKKRI
jgi:hypothetical protein